MPAAADAESQVFTAVYKKVSPSVVRVDNLLSVSSNRGNADPTTEALPESLGSGWVWDASGHIVTNNHVVSGADALNVTFADGIEVPAELVGTDPDSDLAVLKVDPTHVQLIPADRGKLEEVVVGQRAIAIGNPFGYDNSITTGIVERAGTEHPVRVGVQHPPGDPDRCGDQPGQLGRAAAERPGTGDWRQLPH